MRDEAAVEGLSRTIRYLLATHNASPSASSLWEYRLRSLLDDIGQGEGWVTKG